MKTVRILAAALALGLAVTAVAAGPKSYGQYPCDPHPTSKLPPIIVPPIKWTPAGPTVSPTKQAAPKVVKGK